MNFYNLIGILTSYFCDFVIVMSASLCDGQNIHRMSDEVVKEAKRDRVEAHQSNRLEWWCGCMQSRHSPPCIKRPFATCAAARNNREKRVD
jgi:hypothetical protein